MLSRRSSVDGRRILGTFFCSPNGAPLGRPIELVGRIGVRDGRTALRKATGF